MVRRRLRRRFSATLDITGNKYQCMPDIKKILILLFAAVITACAGCNKEPLPPDDEGLNITGVSIPSSISVTIGGEITLTGKGFAVNDRIEFVLTTDAGKVYSSTVTVVTATGATLTLPAGIVSGGFSES